jgi:hypothetical protein
MKFRNIYELKRLVYPLVTEIMKFYVSIGEFLKDCICETQCDTQ